MEKIPWAQKSVFSSRFVTRKLTCNVFQIFKKIMFFFCNEELFSEITVRLEFGITCRRSTTDQMNHFMCCTDIPSVL